MGQHLPSEISKLLARRPIDSRFLTILSEGVQNCKLLHFSTRSLTYSHLILRELRLLDTDIVDGMGNYNEILNNSEPVTKNSAVEVSFQTMLFLKQLSNLGFCYFYIYIRYIYVPVFHIIYVTYT